MTIEQIAIKNVVNGSHIVRTAKDRKRQMRKLATVFGRCRLKAVRDGGVEVYRKELQAFVRPTLVKPIERLQVCLATRRPRRRKVEQDAFAAPGRQSKNLTGGVWQRKVRRRYWNQQPGLK